MTGQSSGSRFRPELPATREEKVSTFSRLSEMMREARPGWDWASPAGPLPRSVAPGSLAGFRVRASALSARRDGPDLQVAGSIPVDLAYWGIRDPAGAGVLGSLADHGEAEFRLTLTRR
jgi:hypothetical protein